jgi:hypothetical protein
MTVVSEDRISHDATSSELHVDRGAEHVAMDDLIVMEVRIPGDRESLAIPNR